MTLRIMLIGGSNTVMAEGYKKYLREALQLGGGVQAEYIDLAVGGSPIVVGLERVLETAAPADVAIVEYMVNDQSLATESQLVLHGWVYEEIIRHLVGRNPAIRIVSLLLGRRDAKSHQRQALLAANIRALAGHYAQHLVIDADAYLKTHLVEFGAAYDSDVHYGQDAAAMIALLVAAHLPRILAAQAAALPSRRLLGAPGPLRLLRPAGETRVFANSRYELETTVLRPGASLSLQLTGRLVALSVIAHEQSGDLALDIDDETSLLHTLHQEVSDGKYPFLLKSFPLRWRDWRSLVPNGERVRLRAGGPAPEDAARPVRSNWKMIPPRRPDSPVFLRHLMVVESG